ncbi:hypothetical protein KFK09_006740 [Dendrobium nobile]|uniref:Uncharacterized protein n=1 Tax=Dendrobium nobile TaxID=94219 RepID=A0A8T3BQC3_DENNO|nr:hypothetical protein KFK09_006740 [Dendrobium nobile]
MTPHTPMMAALNKKSQPEGSIPNIFKCYPKLQKISKSKNPKKISKPQNSKIFKFENQSINRLKQKSIHPPQQFAGVDKLKLTFAHKEPNV